MSVTLVFVGLTLRYNVWYSSEPIRYLPDMQNAWRWGIFARECGIFNVYEDVVLRSSGGAYVLDYPPVRLAVCYLWAKSEYSENVLKPVWENTWRFNRLLLYTNEAMEIAAAILSAVLVYCILRVGQPEASAMNWYRAFGAALLLWLNPAVLLSTHGRPTWDVWIVPFFLAAAMCIMTRRWFVAGALIGIGSMFKGQELAALPFCIACVIVYGGPKAVWRLMLGVVIAIAVIVAPWVFSFKSSGGSGVRWGSIAFVGLVAAVPLLIGRSESLLKRLSPTTRENIAAIMKVDVVACVCCLSFYTLPWTAGGSFSWVQVSFAYGISKFSDFEIGHAYSLGAIVEALLGPFLARHYSVRCGVQLVLGSLFVCTSALSGLVAGWRVRTPAFLVTLAMPWLLFFIFMPRVHERYLLWAVATCAASSVCYIRVFLAMLVLSGLSWLMTVRVMLLNGDMRAFTAAGISGRYWCALADSLYPNAAWIVLALAAAMMLLSSSWEDERCGGRLLPLWAGYSFPLSCAARRGGYVIHRIVRGLMRKLSNGIR